MSGEASRDSLVSARITVVGFLMSCVIAVYHCRVSFPNNLSPAAKISNGMVDSFVDQMAIFAMTWFFAVTGYLLFKGLTMKSYPAKIARRAFSLVIPFVIWQVITAVFNYTVQGVHLGVVDFLAKTFLLQRWPPNGPMWYMWVVFLLAVVLSPMLLVLFRRRDVGFVSVMALSIFFYWISGSGGVPFRAVIRYGLMPNIISHLPPYLMGAYCATLKSDDDNDRIGGSLVCACIVAFVLNPIFPGFGSSFVTKILPVLALFYLPIDVRLADWKVFKLAFPIYAIHRMVIALFLVGFQNWISSFVGSPSWINVGCRFYCLLWIMACSAFLYFGLKRIAPRALSLLTGGR